MSERNLKVSSRDVPGKEASKKLRQVGRVPAVAYGHKEAPVKLALDAHELQLLLTHGGAHGLIMLQDEAGGAETPVIIKSVQRHPYKRNELSILSVDFLRVSMDEEITITVPVVLEGEPSDMRANDGVLVQSLHEIVVSARPRTLPEAIHVDVSSLVFNGPPIHVSEITLPEGVTAITVGETPIAVVNPPEPEEAPEALAELVEAEGVNADEQAASKTELEASNIKAEE